jgi:hypothetical protein
VLDPEPLSRRGRKTEELGCSYAGYTLPQQANTETPCPNAAALIADVIPNCSSSEEPAFPCDKGMAFLKREQQIPRQYEAGDYIVDGRLFDLH